MMGAKINDVTNTDIEMLIKSGQDVSKYACDFNRRIANGHCEEIRDPVSKASALMHTSRALADLAGRILRSPAGLKELRGSDEKASGKTNVG